jgi:hypothetical protein
MKSKKNVQSFLAWTHLSSARLQNDFKFPFRRLVECNASSKFRVRHQIPCDIFGWPYSLIRSCTNSAYNLPNTDSKKGNRNHQSVGSFSTPRLQISTLRPCKLSKGRVNSFYLFGKISTTKLQLKSRESGMKSKQWNECRRSDYKRGGTPEGMQSLRRRVRGFEFSSGAISKKILRKYSKYALWIGRAFLDSFPPSSLFFFPPFLGWGRGRFLTPKHVTFIPYALTNIEWRVNQIGLWQK